MKQLILRLIEHAGYVVLKMPDYSRMQAYLARLQGRPPYAAHDAERKLIEAEREFRLVRNRDERDLEKARAETWQFRMQAREYHDQLVQALDDIRRLKIGVEDVPRSTTKC